MEHNDLDLYTAMSKKTPPNEPRPAHHPNINAPPHHASLFGGPPSRTPSADIINRHETELETGAKKKRMEYDRVLKHAMM